MAQTQMIMAEKTLFDVLRDVWRAKYYILVAFVFSMAVAYAFIGFANRYYGAEMIVAPVFGLSQQSSAAGAQEGTLEAPVSSLNVSDVFERFSATYYGASVAAELLKDKKIRNALQGDLPFEFSNPMKDDWDAPSLSAYIKKRIRMEAVHGTKMRRISYAHPNTDFSAYMLSRVHSISDELIRLSVLKDVTARISYLDKALSEAKNPAYQRSLMSLLMEQERLKMLVSAEGQPFAAAIIEPAFVMSKPIWPDSYIIYPLFAFIGFFLGFIVYGLRFDAG